MVDSRISARLKAELVIEQPKGLTQAIRTFTKHYRARRRRVILGTAPVNAQLCQTGTAVSFEVVLMSGDEATREYVKVFGAAVIELAGPRKSLAIMADNRTAIVSRPMITIGNLLCSRQHLIRMLSI